MLGFMLSQLALRLLSAVLGGYGIFCLIMSFTVPEVGAQAFILAKGQQTAILPRLASVLSPRGTVVSGILPPTTAGNGGPTDPVSIGPTLPQILKGNLPLP